MYKQKQSKAVLNKYEGDMLIHWWASEVMPFFIFSL